MDKFTTWYFKNIRNRRIHGYFVNQVQVFTFQGVIINDIETILRQMKNRDKDSGDINSPGEIIDR